MTKRKPNKGEETRSLSTFTIVPKGDNSLLPILAAGSGTGSITPPSRGGDKTERDRQRYKERQKGKRQGQDW